MHDWCLGMMRQKTEAAGSILKCIEIYSLPRFSQMQQSWLDGASYYKWTLTQNIQQKQSPDLNQSCISLAEDKTKGRKSHKQTNNWSQLH